MIVADTNLVAYMLIKGQMTQEAEGVRARDRRWVAPALLRSELLSVLAAYVTSGRLDRDEAARFYRRGLSLVSVADRDSDPLAVFDLCKRSGCSSYDAEFVWLAAEMRVPLVTADQGIVQSFPDVAVTMSSFAATR